LAPFLLYLEKYAVPIGYDFHLFGLEKSWKNFFGKRVVIVSLSFRENFRNVLVVVECVISVVYVLSV